MTNFKAVSYINGVFLCWLAVALCVPLIYDVIFSTGKCVYVFAPSILACIFLGISIILSCKIDDDKVSLSRQDIFLLTVSLWVTIPIFSALPFYIYKDMSVNFITALFESTSGLTTTGTTIYENVEILPRAIHVWRFMLHLIGGVGIVALGIVALPLMKVGGMQLFLAENSDKSQKFLPRASQIAGLFVWTYVVIIAIFAIWLKLAGMSLFDSVCHSISAIATGGFSTKNDSITHFHSNYITFILSLAMLTGGLTFLEIVKCSRNGFKGFFKSQQTRGYFKIILISSLGCILVSYFIDKDNVTVKNSIDYFFEILSSMTTTGFSMPDSGHQSFPAFQTILMIVTVIGSCSGSTAGGVKVFRFQILYSVLKNHFKQVAKPYDVSIAKYQGKMIDDDLATSVITFCSLFAVTVMTSVLSICMTGADGVSSSFAVISSICNAGYDIHLHSLSWIARFILVIDMIVGRLEVIPTLIIFTHVFWKK